MLSTERSGQRPSADDAIVFDEGSGGQLRQNRYGDGHFSAIEGERALASAETSTGFTRYSSNPADLASWRLWSSPKPERAMSRIFDVSGARRRPRAIS